ncbi:MAG: hypothetical protein HS111_30645 [Kofleriaceae bacterium]|nr:hypothetical protein [Kofleriaceae bacterium]
MRARVRRAARCDARQAGERHGAWSRRPPPPAPTRSGSSSPRRATVACGRALDGFDAAPISTIHGFCIARAGAGRGVVRRPPAVRAGAGARRRRARAGAPPPCASASPTCRWRPTCSAATSRATARPSIAWFGLVLGIYALGAPDFVGAARRRRRRGDAGGLPGRGGGGARRPRQGPRGPARDFQD